jgi:hypothetical protein
MSFHARSNRIAAAGDRDLRASVDTAGGPRSTAQAAPGVYNHGDDEPTRADLLKQLETKHAGGVLAEKKKALAPIQDDLEFLSRKLILTNADRIQFSRGLFTANELDEKRPGKGSLTKTAFSNKVYDLYSVLNKIRSTQQFRDMEDESALKFENCWDSINHFVTLAKELFRGSQEKIAKGLTVTIVGIERNRKFLENGFLPDDEAHRQCPSCLHTYVDIPEHCLGVVQRNMDAAAEFDRKKRDAEAANAKDPASKVGMPRKLAMEESYKVCHCNQFNCWGQPDGRGNLCPIKCKDKSGKPYGFDASRTCLCPICNCQCSFATKVRC